MSKPDGGQAFPKPGDEELIATDGMSLRDYFAAKAMQSIYVSVLASPPLAAKLSERGDVGLTIAVDAYKAADAMLEARKK